MRTAIECLALLLTIGIWTPAQAATISYARNWTTSDTVNSGTNTDNQLDALDDSTTLILSQFDPTLGLLQSIEISVSGMRLDSSANADFRDDNWYDVVQGNQELYNMFFTLSMPGFGFQRTAADRQDTCQDTGVTRTQACSTHLANVTTPLTSASTSLTAASALAAYTGTGNVFFDVFQNADFWTNEYNGDDGYVDYRYGNVSTGGTVQVTYDYTPVSVPEPATIWLLGAALGLLGWIKRKSIS